MPVKLTISDLRALEVSIPAEGEDLDKFTYAQRQAFADGYTLVSAHTLVGGTQRDPITTGVRLVFSR